MLHPRIAQLRDPFDEGGQQAYGVESGSISRSLSGSTPSFRQPKARRGRPEKQLNPSAQRGLIRLFVEASKTPLEQITKALDQCDGHGRLWVRNFLQKVTGAGRPHSDLNLKDIRFKGDDTSTRQPAVECLATGSASNNSSADESNARRKARRTRGSHVVAVDHDQIAAQADPLSTLEPLQLAGLGIAGDIVDSIDQQWKVRTATAAEVAIAEESATEIKPELSQAWTAHYYEEDHVPRTCIRFTESPALVQGRNERGHSPNNANENVISRHRRKPRRRGTSLTLTNMAMFLDKERKGTHYRLAKVNTISRRMSSATSEFSMFYHSPTYMNAVSPTACMYPLSGSILPMHGQNGPPPEAEAIKILTTAWMGSTHDVNVTNELERTMVEGRGGRKAFVNTKDERGVSPLHLTVAYGYPLACQLLLKSGANVKATTTRGTSIYDFAESAARRTKEDMGLYFRILHCRKFVCAGEEPPAPTKSMNPRVILRKRPRRETINQSPKFLDDAEPRTSGGQFEISMAHQEVFGPDPFTGQMAQPWWQGGYTDSPPGSIFHKHFSLPVIDELESTQVAPARRSTAAVLRQTSPNYAKPSPSVIDPGECPSGSSKLRNAVAYVFPHAARSTETYNQTGERRHGNLNNIDGQTKAGSALSQAYPYPGPYDMSSQRPTERSSFDTSAFQQSQETTSMLQLDLNRFPVPGNAIYGVVTAAQSLPHVDSVARQPSAFESNQQYQAMLRSNTHQQDYIPSWDYSANISRPVNHNYQSAAMCQPPQQSFYDRPNTYIPSSMSQNNLQATPLHVTVAAHYSDDPAMYKCALANDYGGGTGLRLCPFRNPQCGGICLCDPCIESICYNN